MRPGDVIAGRFVLERVAGTGGMASVFLARDEATGGPVAVKILRTADPSMVARFAREADVLRELGHPAVVRYVAHGAADDELWLAMEWLEGEDLSDRLARRGLPPADALALVRRVAEALGWAHERGVVHRDVKPANVFLPDGDVTRAKVLDFGIARIRHGAAFSTRAGAVLGTPGYMAPEQANGRVDVDARADVFSLGCVLFECLTGRPPFVGDHPMALLAKILLEDPPRLEELLPDAPPALASLVASMLAKDPRERPADGLAVAAALDGLGEIAPSPAAPASRKAASLTGGEQRLICVILGGCTEVGPASAPTIGTDQVMADLERLRAVAAAHHGRLEPLADGSFVVTLSASRSATDLAVHAARCALALRPTRADAPMAMATGLAVLAGRLPVGEVIERAAKLLRGAEAVPVTRGADSTAPGAVRIDDVTAGLLDVRFDVRGDGDRLWLCGERATVDTVRTLLGKPSPFVGRERELRALVDLVRECIEEPVARVVVVTAPPGAGKSRLRQELLRAITTRAAELFGDRPGPEIWLGRGDPMSAGSPFGMIAPALRSSAGILDGEPLASRRHKLRARVARHVAPEAQSRVAEFLGELVGSPLPDDDSVQLRAARRDAVLLGDQMRRAWEDFVDAETAARPVVLVLEDLHWGDRPSIAYVDAALRHLANRPLFVLALGRPELSELFPDLWTARHVERVVLSDLRRSAAERLVREALGGDIDAGTVARLVDRAGGNAFYLEELVRAVAAGKGDRLPETVLAMVQARVEGLEAEARRVLRAASVFGQVAWRGGIGDLLGGAQRTGEIDEWLGLLVEREVLANLGEGRFAGERAFGFRHGLVREAAYASLTEADRRLGHRLAAEWLEKAGETEAFVLAEHYERGGDALHAAQWFRRAAEQALEGNDFTAAASRAARGRASGATGELLGALFAVEADALRWGGSNAESEAPARQALELLPRGSAAWLSTAGTLVLARGRMGALEGLLEIASELRELLARGPGSGPLVISASYAAEQLLYAARYEEANALLATVDARAGGALLASDPIVRGRVASSRASRALQSGDPAAHRELRTVAAACFAEAGDMRHACLAQASLGYGHLEVGANAEAEASLRTALAAAERMGLSQAAAAARHNLGLALMRRGALDEACAVEAAAADEFQRQSSPRMEGGSRIYLALMHVERGDSDAAEREARRAVAILDSAPGVRTYAVAALARALLAAGKVAEAMAASDEAMAQLRSLGELEEGEIFLRTTHGEALEAAGRLGEAREAVAIAKRRLLEKAARIADPALREGFLTRIPENARTLALAKRFADAGLGGGADA